MRLITKMFRCFRNQGDCLLKGVSNKRFYCSKEVLIQTCGIVFGSPYLYDRRSIFHRHENKYHLFKNGVEYIVRAHIKKVNLSLTNAGQMKRLVNDRNNLVLLMI
jgi:hypothetical protein